MKRLILSSLVVAMLLVALPAFSQVFSDHGKKLIEYGWDVRSAAGIKGNEATIEQYPFDGTVFRLDKFTLAFDTELWPDKELKPQADTVRNLKWKKYNQNFMILYSANDKGMSWFNDAQWRIICANAGKFAKIAKAGKCVGIIFDPEAYGKDPWIYPGDYKDNTYDQVGPQIRKRGAQWMKALQKDWPDIKVLLFYFSPDQKDTLGAFCTGMLEAAGPKVKIIDGNEGSYYHTSSDGYLEDWKRIRQTYATRIDPKLKAKYDRNVQVGMALYMDQSLALREPTVNYISYYMRPSDRLKYFEHAVYWAMKTTDEYVWCYSERLDWWKGLFPRGADEAIRNARHKLETSSRLGFTLGPIVRNAKTARDQAISGNVKKRAVDVTKVPQGTAAPVIDGNLADDIWGRIQPLEPFVPPATAPANSPVIPTTVKVTYDDTNLYLAIDCSEPEMSGLALSGTGRDSDIWRGDTIEVFVSDDPSTPYAYKHFILNPANAQWDGISPPDNNDSSWNADWKSAVSKSPTSWTVEMAIPWTALNGKPPAGSMRFANICRQRRMSEWTSWSSVVEGFLDAARFGDWTFKE